MFLLFNNWLSVGLHFLITGLNKALYEIMQFYFIFLYIQLQRFILS